MNLFYEDEDYYPEYSMTYHYSEVKKKLHLPSKRDYVIKECTIELNNDMLYTFTYAHINSYKKNI